MQEEAEPNHPWWLIFSQTLAELCCVQAQSETAHFGSSAKRKCISYVKLLRSAASRSATLAGCMRLKFQFSHWGAERVMYLTEIGSSSFSMCGSLCHEFIFVEAILLSLRFRMFWPSTWLAIGLFKWKIPLWLAAFNIFSWPWPWMAVIRNMVDRIWKSKDITELSFDPAKITSHFIRSMNLSVSHDLIWFDLIFIHRVIIRFKIYSWFKTSSDSKSVHDSTYRGFIFLETTTVCFARQMWHESRVKCVENLGVFYSLNCKLLKCKYADKP